MIVANKEAMLLSRGSRGGIIVRRIGGNQLAVDLDSVTVRGQSLRD